MIALMADVLRADSVCIDVGAHNGRILRCFLEHAPFGRHYAFEPLPHMAAALSQNFSRVIVRECALGETDGVTTFQHALNLPAWSGFKLQEYPLQVQTQEILVEMRKLDGVIPPDTPVHFIKIDVEGAELQVLRGAINTIRRCRPYVVFEYGEIHGLPYGTTPELLHDYLTSECRLNVFSLLGKRPRLSRESFATICRAATASNYARSAQGNFLACSSLPHRVREPQQRA